MRCRVREASAAHVPKSERIWGRRLETVLRSPDVFLFLRAEILRGVRFYCFFNFWSRLRSVRVERKTCEVFFMPLLTFDKVLKIISTILNILSAALNAFGSSWSNQNPQVDENSDA